MPPRTAAKEKILCLDCKEVVADNQHSVECSICVRWIHKECLNDDDEYKLIQKIARKKGSHFWSCDGCSRGLGKLQQMVQVNQKEIATLKEAVDEIKTDNDLKATNIEDNKKNVSSLLKDVEDLKKNSSENNCKSVVEEFELRNSKKANLVIFSLEEQDSTLDHLERKELDTETLADIFTTIKCNIDIDKDVKFVTRIGVYKENSQRPLTIGFHSEETKDLVLKSARQLARSKYKHISISPDLTKMQMLKERELLAQAKVENDKLTPTEAKNYQWRLVGRKGQRQLRKVKKKDELEPTTRARTGSVRTRAEMEADDLPTSNQEEGSSHQSKKQC